MKDTLERNGFWKQFELHVQFQLIVTVTYSYHFRFRIQAILHKINGKFRLLRPLQMKWENGAFCPSRCFILVLRVGGLLFRFILSNIFACFTGP